jgi:hypothetical protein
VEQYILENKLKAARKMTLFICKQRRFEKRNWEANSEYILLALVLYSFKQVRRFQLVLNRIKDPVIKKNVLHTANKIIRLNENLMIEYKILCGILNINHSIELVNDEVVYLGINFGSPKLSESAALIKILALNPAGLDKESLCKTIWNSSEYDPTYHDQKIYRLISKIRKQLGRTATITNHYNFYKLCLL